jgi:chitin disaccharide deacetylase
MIDCVMTDFKKITLCADDFGLSYGISQAILKLARMKRLSAVSCMVNTAHFSQCAKDLIALSDEVQIGLHFNLTEGFFISELDKRCFSLVELLAKTHLHLVAVPLIENELKAQLDCFIQIMGRWPDFIDGHQHIHQFPIIRTVLLKLYEQCLRPHQVFIRSTYPILSLSPYQFKSTILPHTGGKKLKKVLIQRNIAHNKWFGGIYDFSPTTNYRALFQQWLQRAPDDTLIMCHPGEGQQEADPIVQARQMEMAYFASNEFVEDCAHYQVQI